MSPWDRRLHRLRDLLGLGSPVTPTPVSGDPQPMQPRVLLVTYNPLIRSARGQKLSEVLGWYNVGDLTCEYIADIRECSAGFIEFQIVDRMEVDIWPVKADGFRYDERAYLRCWNSRSGWHQPDTVDYGAIIAHFELLNRVESGQIDEVWLFGFPYAGFYESIMVGPGAFWCNAPPIPTTAGIQRRFVIMGFNYERDVGPMLESMGHRFESHLKHTWRRHLGADNLWEQFRMYDKIAPGKANCGWMHYAPNSERDYDWGNPMLVPSNCDDWVHFPDFQGRVRPVNCSEWGGGDMRAHHKWWYKHLPKAPGHTHGIANNWWLYGVDPNAVS
jgi:hypothetical protein